MKETLKLFKILKISMKVLAIHIREIIIEGDNQNKGGIWNNHISLRQE